jgi:creatinine amidohydrolase
MLSLPNRWDALRSADFAQLDGARTVAVLPLGATEQHGPHLPLDVDRVLVEAMVAGALPNLQPGAPVLVLPTFSIGLSTEHTAFAGTLSLSTETTLRALIEIGHSVARAGVRKLLMFNAHGGHVSVMDLVARELRGSGLTVFHSRLGWHAQDLHPSGAVGRPDLADPARGAALLAAVSAQLAVLLGQIIEFDPLS